MQTVSNTNINQKKKKTQGTRQKQQLWPWSVINISHILIMAHGFKVYRIKALCIKNKHMREREREREQ